MKEKLSVLKKWGEIVGDFHIINLIWILPPIRYDVITKLNGQIAITGRVQSDKVSMVLQKY